MIETTLNSPGQPLDATTRAAVEPSFGHDFSGVRVHADPAAARSADAVHAHAYKVGQHVVFSRGEFSPDTRDGRRLLVHELTHVVQNSAHGRAGVGGPYQLSQPGDASEREARAAEQQVDAGETPRAGVAPGATLQRNDRDTALGIGGAVLGAGLLGLGIAYFAGAFDTKKPPGSKQAGTKQESNVDSQTAAPKPTFEEALKEGATVLKPEFGLTTGGTVVPGPDDGYDASEWKKKRSEPEGDAMGGAVIVSTTSSSWTAMDHLIKNIGKDVPKSDGSKTKWSFDCFEYVEVLRLYALWRTMEKDEFDKTFPQLEIGFTAPRINQEWGKAFRADRPKQAPYQYSDPKDVESGGVVRFGSVSKVSIKKTWAELLAEAPVGSQVIWSNIEAIGRCTKDPKLDFCAYQNENATKLGPDSYSAHPFGVQSEEYIRNGVASAVLEYDAKQTTAYKKLAEDKQEAFVKDYVDKRLKAYLDKNIFISAVRYPANLTGPAKPSGGK